MYSLMKPLRRLFVPAVLLLLSLYLVFDLSFIKQQYQPLLVYLPYPLLAITMLLAQQFNRLRIFASALIFLLSFMGVQQGLQQSLETLPAFYLYSVMGVLLPLNILFLALMPERGLWGGAGFIVLVLASLQLLALWLMPMEQVMHLGYFQYLLDIRPAQDYLLSLLASAVFAIAAVLILVILCYRNGETEAVLLVCLFSAYFTLLLFYKPYISAILFSCSGMCLMYCVFRSSHDMAFRDDLTGIRNRRAFNEKMRSLGRRYVIATMDIDHFKKFNDTHGHEVGDDVLRLVAAKINQVGGGGVAYRYGGEEFCVVFTGGQSSEECAIFLEQVRVAIERYSITLRNQDQRPSSKKQGQSQRGGQGKAKTVSVTISIGVAERGEKLRKAEEVLKASDTALYQAKKKGRNCLILA